MRNSAMLLLGGAAFALALVAAPIVSTAQPAPAPTMVPVAKPDFTSMMFLTGTWTCTQMLRGKQRPDTSTTTIDKDGVWMVTQDVAPPFDQYRTFAVNSTTWTTYDPTIKQWVTVGNDNTGGYFIASTPGWQGNTMTSASTGLDGTKVTDVLTKVSDTETNDVNTVTDPQGKATTANIHCTKSAS
jgi:hypothetical protein